MPCWQPPFPGAVEIMSRGHSSVYMGLSMWTSFKEKLRSNRGNEERKVLRRQRVAAPAGWREVLQRAVGARRGCRDVGARDTCGRLINFLW